MLTGLCFLDKYDVMLVGGKNYRNGQYGSGFIVHGNTTHFDVVFEGGPAMTSVACKGLGSPGIRYGEDSVSQVCGRWEKQCAAC